jgi:two-component system chemotaxis response regulator CheB
MEEKPERERPVALTCPTCGGAVAQTTEGDLPSFTCHLGHSFAADKMGEAQFHETRRVLEICQSWRVSSLMEVHGKTSAAVAALA